MDFETAMTNWLNAVDTLILAPQLNDEWIKNHGHPYTKLVIESGNKFVKVISDMGNGSKSVWAFVALDDGQNKGMGAWKKGDIFKPAGWNAPAKHARGNIFENENNPTCNVKHWTGPEYLRA